MAIMYNESASGIGGTVVYRQTAQNRLAAINKIPPINGHFQAIATPLKGASLVARAKSVNSIAPASPTINPARYNGFLTFDLTPYIPLSFQGGGRIFVEGSYGKSLLALRQHS